MIPILDGLINKKLKIIMRMMTIMIRMIMIRMMMMMMMKAKAIVIKNKYLSKKIYQGS